MNSQIWNHSTFLDEEICRKLLVYSGSIRAQLRGEVGLKLKLNGNGDNFIIIGKGQLSHEGRMTSLDRWSAACALWILKHKIGIDLPAPNDRAGGVLEQIPEAVRKGFKNDLADAHKIPNDTVLYYIYNSGLHYMTEFFPVETTVLIRWQEKHQDVLFANREGKVACKPQAFRKASTFYRTKVGQNGFNNVDEVVEYYIKKGAHVIEEMNKIEKVEIFRRKDRLAKELIAAFKRLKSRITNNTLEW